jgi:hypothetical protein
MRHCRVTGVARRWHIVTGYKFGRNGAWRNHDWVILKWSANLKPINKKNNDLDQHPAKEPSGRQKSYRKHALAYILKYFKNLFNF